MKKQSMLTVIMAVLVMLITGMVVADDFQKSTQALQWRFIGPIVGNRGSVVLGHPTKSNVFYHGASNGLWKTEDAGIYWMPVGDQYFKSGNIGAMDISESNPTLCMWVWENLKCVIM